MSDARARGGERNWTETSLGERVEYICALRGWSLNKLGETAGLASGVMSRLARRDKNTAGAPDTLMRVADAAHVSVLWLMLGRGPIEAVEPGEGTLRNHPDWPAVLAEAKKWQRGIPDEFWERAGDASFPAAPLDWQLVVGIVRELYSAHQRALEEAERSGEAAPLRARRGPRGGAAKR